MMFLLIKERNRNNPDTEGGNTSYRDFLMSMIINCSLYKQNRGNLLMVFKKMNDLFKVKKSGMISRKA
ncbi:hypothetical protein CQA21_18785 [Proteus mirabilis]|nr:hypothetical protein CQA21_18785 [Proteus mirabilis]